MTRTPLATGFDAALRHLRLALCLWLSLFATALLAWSPIRHVFDVLDESPFREALLKGWDSMAFVAFTASRGRDLALALSAAGTAILVGVLLHVFLTMGVLRVLIADVERPVMRRLVAESAALFRQNLWAALRFAVTLLFWEGLLVGIPVAILKKLAKDAPPNGPLSTLAVWWILVVGLIVLFNVILRLDLARVALARGDSPTARGAYRVAKQRIAGSRASALGLFLFWLAAAAACQVLFSRIGFAMSPRTDGGVTGLLVVRQFGFLALMTLRVGWWASLLSWEKLRRPMAMPERDWKPAPVAVSAAV